MFLSETIKKEADKAIEEALKTGKEMIAMESGFFVTTKKEQPEGVGIFLHIDKDGKTFYVCQKIR